MKNKLKCIYFSIISILLIIFLILLILSINTKIETKININEEINIQTYNNFYKLAEIKLINKNFLPARKIVNEYVLCSVIQNKTEINKINVNIISETNKQYYTINKIDLNSKETIILELNINTRLIKNILNNQNSRMSYDYNINENKKHKENEYEIKENINYLFEIPVNKYSYFSFFNSEFCKKLIENEENLIGKVIFK